MDELLRQTLFQGWEPLLRTAIGTAITYVALVVLLCFTGQRTLAKWYAFDLIVTVALGRIRRRRGCAPPGDRPD